MTRKANPWQSGLLTTSGLAAVIFSASLLWQAGHAQWAFVLTFTAVWALISISWSNVDFAERSGTILARIVDHNFGQMHERLIELEQEVEALRSALEQPYRKAS
jgi:hypothetical protein